MATKKQIPIDCTSYGPVIDSQGSMESCFNNLEGVLISLFEENPNILRGTKCTISKSYVGYERNGPFRYEKPIIKTVGQLLSEYRGWSHSNGGFNLEQAKENREWRFQDSEREGRQRAAWGGYVQAVSYQKAVDRERNYAEQLYYASPQEKEKILKRKKKEEQDGGSQMYIG